MSCRKLPEEHESSRFLKCPDDFKLFINPQQSEIVQVDKDSIKPKKIRRKNVNTLVEKHLSLIFLQKNED